MGRFEGGGNFGRFEDIRRHSPENPYGRGIETRGDQGIEDRAERENYWLAEIGVTPEKLDPAHEGASAEYLIYQLLLGKLVETGVEWDPLKKARVRNLVGVLRVIGYPNMTETEQESLLELSQATTVNMASLQYNVTPEIITDVRWIWRTFDLQMPDRYKAIFRIPQARSLPNPTQP